MRYLIETLVVVLAVARLTRVVCADEITKPVRAAVVRRLPRDSPVAYLVFCRWCVSVWIGLAAAVGWWLVSPRPQWSGRWWIDVPSVALALSYATGLLVRAEPEA